MSKSLFFPVKSFLGNFYGHLADFYWSHWLRYAEIIHSDWLKVVMRLFNFQLFKIGQWMQQLPSWIEEIKNQILYLILAKSFSSSEVKLLNFVL